MTLQKKLTSFSEVSLLYVLQAQVHGHSSFKFRRIHLQAAVSSPLCPQRLYCSRIHLQAAVSVVFAVRTSVAFCIKLRHKLGLNDTQHGAEMVQFIRGEAFLTAFGQRIQVG